MPHDSPDDFSHLPTVDEQDLPVPAAAGWEKPAEKRTRISAPSRPAAPASPAEPAEPSQAAPTNSEAWRDLLELEPDADFSYSAPAPAPAPPSAPAERKRTVIRSKKQPEPEPETAPEPHFEWESQPQQEPEPQPAPEPAPSPKTSEAPEEAPAPPAKAPSESAPTDSTPAETPAAADDKASDPDKSAPAPDSDPAVADAQANPKSVWRQKWEKVGGGALSLSLLIHLLLIGGGGLYVMKRVMEPSVDFLPGGGTEQGQAASQDLQHKIQQKKNPWLKRSMPLQRLVSMNSVSDVVLPEEVPNLLDLPDASSQLIGGKLSGGMGLGGAMGGFGKGMGLGSKSGMVFQPLSMFGREIKAKRMALVLDVSASMAPHLPRVIAEVDRVARDSVVVLYVGCGLEAPPPRGIDGDDVFRTSGVEFEKFWRLSGGTYEEARKFRINPKDPIPSEQIFRLLSRRPQTYFIHANGLGYTWLALLSNEVRNADALYWFSDFQDRVEYRQMLTVRENLVNRKQRLYIHAYMRGSAFDSIVTQLVQPTGGDVIEETE